MFLESRCNLWSWKRCSWQFQASWFLISVPLDEETSVAFGECPLDLRDSLEPVVLKIYYTDHPIEFEPENLLQRSSNRIWTILQLAIHHPNRFERLIKFWWFINLASNACLFESLSNAWLVWRVSCGPARHGCLEPTSLESKQSSTEFQRIVLVIHHPKIWTHGSCGSSPGQNLNAWFFWFINLASNACLFESVLWTRKTCNASKHDDVSDKNETIWLKSHEFHSKIQAYEKTHDAKYIQSDAVCTTNCIMLRCKVHHSWCSLHRVLDVMMQSTLVSIHFHSPDVIYIVSQCSFSKLHHSWCKVHHGSTHFWMQTASVWMYFA